MIYQLTIKSAGKTVYDTSNLHKITFVKNLLEYSDDYSRSVAKNSFWYLDTSGTAVIAENTGFAARKSLMTDVNIIKNVNVITPLNRFSFFEELKGRMLVPMQLQLIVQLQNDEELIYKAAAADAGRVVVNRFLLWVPRLLLKGSMYDKFVESVLSKKS